MANTVLGNLQVRLTAVTTNFNKGIGLATRRTRAFSRLMRTDLSRVLPLVAGKLAGLGLRVVARAFQTATKFALIFATAIGITLVASLTLATAGLLALSRSAFKTIDTIGKTARRLGIAVQNMAGFTLAAKEAGIEFNTFSLGLQRMTRRIAEAAQGMGEAQNALKELNLDAEELAKLAPDEQFLKIAEALADVASQGEKIRLGFKLFDSEGVANILITAKAIREATEAARRLGVELSDLDVARIENANDAVGRLKLAFVGVGNQIAIRVSPAIEGLANFMVSKFTEAGTVQDQLNAFFAKLAPLAEATINIIGEAAVNALQFTGDALSATSRAFTKLNNTKPTFAERIARAAIRAMTTMKLVWAGTKAVIIGGMRLVSIVVLNSIKGLVKGLDFLSNKIATFKEVVFGIERIPIPPPDFSEFDKFLEEQKKKTHAVGQEIAEILIDGLALEETLKRGGSIIPPQLSEGLRIVTFEASKAALAFRAVLEAFKDGKTFSEALELALDGLAATYTKVGRGAAGAMIEVEELSEAAQAAVEKTSGVVSELQGVTGTAVDGIVSSLVTAENAFVSLRNVAIRAIDDIAQALLRGAIFQFLSGLFPGSAFVGAVTGIAPKAGSAVLKGIEPSFGQASALSGGGGGDVHINFFGPTSGNDAIREQVIKGIQEAQEGLTNIAVNTMRDRAQRDPGFRAAFAS